MGVLKKIFRGIGWAIYNLFYILVLPFKIAASPFFSAFEKLLAYRYLRARKAEGFVSVIAGFAFAGIMIGVATLIIVMSVMNGFRAELFDRILGLNGHMNVFRQGETLQDYDYLRSIILEVEGVKDVSPLINAQALISHNGRATGVLARGIEWQDFVNKPILRESIMGGNLDDFRGNAIAMGRVLAENLNVRVGDSITLTSPQVKSSPFGSIPRQRAYQIAMIFDVDMYEYNAGTIFMPLDTAQIFFKLDSAVNGLDVFLHDADNLDEVRASVENAVQGQANVIDWRDNDKGFFNALQVERNVMFIILSLIVAVAAFNIISSMMMLVKDKSHDIAIMRTMGATRKNMLKIFMLTGASIGVAGTAAGAFIGIIFALNIETIRRALEGLTGTNLFADEIYFLSQLPAQVEWEEVIGVIIMAFTLSVLATIYPALRAARLNPIDTLRFE